MKKRAFLYGYLILLAGCQLFTPAPRKAFTANAACPNLCWLGINPGTTTAKQAQALLRASTQIDQGSIQISEDNIAAGWYAGNSKNDTTTVDVTLENGRAKTISMWSAWMTITMNDILTLIGEPDEISIIDKQSGNHHLIDYTIFFLSKKWLFLSCLEKI